MILTRKVRIYPTSDVQRILWSISHHCTFLWNFALNERLVNPSLTVYDQKKKLPSLKKENPELKKPSSQVLQNVFFAHDRGWKMYETKVQQGDKKVRPPSFKPQGKFFTQECSQHDVSFAIAGTTLKLAYGFRPQDWLCIELSSGNYDQVKTAIVFYKDKKWFVCLTYSVDLTPLKTEGHVLYIDPGCRTALTALKTTKEFYEYDVQPLRDINRATYKEIDALKKKRARKKKGSYHYQRLTEQIKDRHSKINTRTKVYLHTLANKILEDHPDVKVIYIGDWSKKDTLAQTGKRYVDKRINRAVQNNHPLEKLIGYLTYKARLKGQEVKRFDERGSTKTCVACGYVHKEGIKPSVRIFTCKRCLFKYPRDHHSCLNFIKKKETALWQCLSGKLPDRSTKRGLHPFSFKLLTRARSLVRYPTTLGCHRF